MSTSAVILADSISEDGPRLTTFQVRAPRFILPQLSKHRCLSISCRSSRAVPVRRMIEEIVADPVIPRFGRNARGMQALPGLSAGQAEAARLHWLDARDDAIDRAMELAELGIAKEVCNRLLEPFGWFDAVISATSYANFFALRIHPDAQHEIRELAVLMARAYRDSAPVSRWGDDGWHLPYVTPEEREKLSVEVCIRLSVARCGRVSYAPHDGSAVDVGKDLDRAARFAEEGHWVPWEHAARPVFESIPSGNFWGWEQARERLTPNVHESFDFSILDREMAS